MSEWIVDNLGPDVPLHFSAFFPTWKMTDHPATPKSTLSRSRRIALASGLNYVYTGNVSDPEGSSTYCHRCGETLIGRERYHLGGWLLKVDNGTAVCGSCGAAVAGKFEKEPGTWGSRFQPVYIDG